MHAVQLTSVRRLNRLPQVVRALLPDVIVSAACQLSVPNVACGSFLTWSGALGRCGPAPTTARSAAPLCLLHLRRAAEEEGSCGPSIGRKTQCWYWCVPEVFAVLESYPPTAGVQTGQEVNVGPPAHRAPHSVALVTKHLILVTHDLRWRQWVRQNETGVHCRFIEKLRIKRRLQIGASI